MNAGYEKSKIEIVGFSLGAQIGALVARSIPNFPRLTALDPGQVPSIPLAGNPVGKILSSSDALFVMTIHTETDSFGDKKSLGHVNGWFNGANRQPMCLILYIGKLNLVDESFLFFNVFVFRGCSV
jgi:dienelactone hydrolase